MRVKGETRLKAYDTKDFIAATRALNVTAHVTKNQKGRRSNLDRRTRRAEVQQVPRELLRRRAAPIGPSRQGRSS